MSLIVKEKNYLLYLLAKQEYSVKQLKIKLQNRANLSNEEINSLLDDFIARKWVCDFRFARVFLSNEICKKRGLKRILNNAYQKGLNSELILNIADEMQIDWFDLCLQCLNKKYKDISKLNNDFKLKQKAISYLLYNGFNFEQINHCFNNSY